MEKHQGLLTFNALFGVFRRCCPPVPEMFTIGMRLATFRRVICAKVTSTWRWRFDHDFHFLEAGKLTTTLATMFPAISICTTKVRYNLAEIVFVTFIDLSKYCTGIALCLYDSTRCTTLPVLMKCVIYAQVTSLSWRCASLITCSMIRWLITWRCA